MPGTTPLYQFPYPLGSDPIRDGDNVIHALSDRLEEQFRTTPLHASNLGVVGDGTTDDSAALEAACVTAAAARRPLSLIGLNVHITRRVDIAAGTELHDGQINASAAGYNMVRPLGDGVRFVGVEFTGAATSDATTQYAIQGDFAPNAATRVTVQGCRFHSVNSGIVVGDGSDWTIVESDFRDLVGVIAGTGYGVLSAGNSLRTTVARCTFVGSSGRGRHAVYFSVGCSYSLAEDNLILGSNEAGIVCRATDTQPGVVGNVIRLNRIIGGGTETTSESSGIVVGGRAVGNLVEDNLVVDFHNMGITVNYQNYGPLCVDNIVRGNRVERAWLVGICVLGAKRTVLLDNQVLDSSQAAAAGSSGIDLRAVGSGGTAEVVDGTIIIGNTVTGAQHRSALYLNAATLPTNTRIVGNTFLGGNLAGRTYELNGAVVVMPPGANLTDQAFGNGTTDDPRQGLTRAASTVSATWGAIAANTTATYSSTFTLTGVATTGWTVRAEPEGALEAGLVASATITAANTITLRLSNVSAGSITPAARVFRLIATRHT